MSTRRIVKGRNGTQKIINPSSGFTPLMISNFDYALGSSVAAQQDGVSPTYKWNFIGGSSACVVVDSTGLDFPTANCLRVPYSPATFSLIRNDRLPILAVGDRRNFRWYIRCVMPESDARISDWNFHPIQDGFAGSNCSWAFEMNTNNGSQWLPWYLIQAETDGVYNSWFAPLINKHTTYYFELQLYRNATATMQLSARIRLTDGTLIADSVNFENAFGTPYNLETVRGNVPGTGDLPMNAVDSTEGINGGANDTYTLTPADPQLDQSYQGAFCVADNVPGGWIGLYDAERGY